jgi:hypothetical protein
MRERKDHKEMLGSFIAPEHMVVDLNSEVTAAERFCHRDSSDCRLVPSAY